VPENLVVAELGNSDMMAIGDEVFVVGAPYGIDHTLTVGFLSGRRKPIRICNQLIPIEFLQTDAAINVGNSGGPMFSWDGKVIGIVSHILSQSGGSEGLGFAISINSAKELLLNQKSFWIGLETYLVSGSLAKALNVPQEAGLLIQRVADNSPAHEMGLEPSMIPVKIGREKILIGGDIVLEVQGIPVSTKIKNVCKIRDTMGGLHQGGSFEIKVLRGGKILTFSTNK
jgi:S1-C subfamily serine protease